MQSVFKMQVFILLIQQACEVDMAIFLLLLSFQAFHNKEIDTD